MTTGEKMHWPCSTESKMNFWRTPPPHCLTASNNIVLSALCTSRGGGQTELLQMETKLLLQSWEPETRQSYPDRVHASIDDLPSVSTHTAAQPCIYGHNAGLGLNEASLFSPRPLRLEPAGIPAAQSDNRCELQCQPLQQSSGSNKGFYMHLEIVQLYCLIFLSWPGSFINNATLMMHLRNFELGPVLNTVEELLFCVSCIKPAHTYHSVSAVLYGRRTIKTPCTQKHCQNSPYFKGTGWIISRSISRSRKSKNPLW